MTTEEKKYHEMEASCQGELIRHALQLLQDRKLGISTRRTLGIGAKSTFKTATCTRVSYQSKAFGTSDFIKVSLQGLARAEDAIAPLTGYAEVIEQKIGKKPAKMQDQSMFF